MSNKVRWGVLGVANIAVKKVIPAMQVGTLSEVTGIASRDLEKAKAAAEKLGIPRVYGSYEEMLADRDIDAVYNPLPNDLHVPWSIKAAEAGKHLLCEKPIGLNAGEARTLIAARDRTRVKMGEAFMVHSHPQWLRARELVRAGAIGRLRAVHGFFSYFNRDPQNIRNKPEMGGGALMDIGCYPITLSRFVFGEEPVRVAGLLEFDPDMGTDRLSSALLEYPSGQAQFISSTQLAPYQRMHLFGTEGRIEIEIPFNAPPDRLTRIIVNDQVEEFPICDQYTLQGDAFSRAIREDGEVPTSLEDSLRNMLVIDAVFASAKARAWVDVPAA